MGIPYLYQGWVSYKEMAPLYFACDAYLIASREEGGPAAVLECMATGTPLVSTRVGMAVDVIRHGENGFLAEIEDVDSLAGHLLELMENPGQRDRISSTALETAPRYDWSVVGPRYGQELYEPALANLHRT
jgi:glycosyltransferase involved in cell wall biosynthesis